ncbi:MAG: hypothetical protein AAF334_11255 [Pseudomonadota bacterium]
MFVVLEIAAVATIGFAVFILFRAAAARPDLPDLRLIARLALLVWVAFALLLLVDLGAILSDPLGSATNLLFAALILAVVMGYRRVLAALRDRAQR